MRPAALRTRIYLDGGDPAETRTVREALGFLDGQTTNPTLMARNPEAQARLKAGRKFAAREVYEFYRGLVGELSQLLPEGSISVEVYADATTTAADMVRQGREMAGWIANAHIKLPITPAGLEAAAACVAEGLRVNLTLCFDQAQVAAVHAATRGAVAGQVYVSPFVGRLDDRGENGMDLIAHSVAMLAPTDRHVQVLAASVRTYDHFLASLALGADIVTCPGKLLLNWAAQGRPLPPAGYSYPAGGLRPIPYQELDLALPWSAYAIDHPLTAAGLARFADDWNALIG